MDDISKNLEDVKEESESGKYVELSSPTELDVVSITQLTNGRIKALDVYEGSDQFLCAAGAENGEIGLWIGNNKTVRMRIHNSAVNDVKLGSMTKLWTTSNDGFVKVRYNFTKTYFNGSESPFLQYFMYLYSVSQENPDSVKNMLLLKNHNFYPIKKEFRIQAALFIRNTL